MKKILKRAGLLLTAAIMAFLFFINPQTAKASTSLDALMRQYVGTVWNGKYYGKECKGFANYVFYRLWDVRYIGPYHSSQKYYIPNPSGAWEVGRLSFNSMSVGNARSLLSKGLPGDFIQVRRRGKSNGHSMILVNKDAGGITVFDCNSDGKKGVKKYRVTWSQFYNKNSAMSLYRANNNKGSSAQTQAPAPAQNSTPTSLPSITNVGIDSIDRSHISLHFTANNAGLARVVFESRNTGKSVRRDFTSGLGRVSIDFSLAELPGTTEMNVLIYAYSTASGGNETLHRVLYGNIPGVVQLPQTPAQAQNPAPASLPSITNVGIDSIDFSHISLHFTANNAGLARVVFESRNTGKSVKRDFTSGLGRVSIDFSLAELPGTTEMNVLIYAYSTVGGGNETLHRVLYGNIPGVVQLPQGNDEIADLCFDPVYYADNNDDVRRAYGYDKEKLLNHWRTWGIAEGRAGSPVWNGKYYLNANKDVAAAYNNDYTMAYKHFITYGYKEKRASSEYYSGTYYQNKYRSEMGSFDGKELLIHFRYCGLREGREANSSRYYGRSSWK